MNAGLGGNFAYTPAIADDGIIHASNGNGLYAFDPQDGEVLWSYYAPCLFLGAPAIARDGTVYIGSNSDRLFAFTPKLGIKWSIGGLHELAREKPVYTPTR